VQLSGATDVVPSRRRRAQMTHLLEHPKASLWMRHPRTARFPERPKASLPAHHPHGHLASRPDDRLRHRTRDVEPPTLPPSDRPSRFDRRRRPQPAFPTTRATEVAPEEIRTDENSCLRPPRWPLAWCQPTCEVRMARRVHRPRVIHDSGRSHHQDRTRTRSRGARARGQGPRSPPSPRRGRAPNRCTCWRTVQSR
jgi:hypothetical protein